VGADAVESMHQALLEALGPLVPPASEPQAFLARERRELGWHLAALDDFLGDIVGAKAALVGSESALIPQAAFLRSHLGALVELAIVTDAPKGGSADPANSPLGQLAARVERAVDTKAVAALLTQAAPLAVLGSALEAPVCQRLGAGLLETSFPAGRVTLGRTYAGYKGAVTLAEDFATLVLKAKDKGEAAMAASVRSL
jgi:nitrogenase molybdenum-iron protein alpha/beta subunit